MRKSRLALVDDWPGLGEPAGFDAATLARLRGGSLRQLERFFHPNSRRSHRAWLNDLRVTCAARRLASGEEPKAVAAECGFCDVSHFYNRFRPCFGVTPREFAALENHLADSRSLPLAEARGGGKPHNVAPIQ